MRRFTSLVLVGAVLAAGCSASITSPSPAPGSPVRVTVQQNPTFAGGMAIFTLKVENVSQSVVDLTFPSSCQILPYFTERATGRAVTPVGGGFVCLTVITGQTLQPGGSFFTTVTVKPGSVTEPQAIVLPPGEYLIRARLEDSVYKLNSDPVAFTVQ
jgi:hypothetical protein